MAVAAAVCGVLAVADFAARWDVSAAPLSSSTPAPAALVAQGHALFGSSCASCHGLNAQGVTGRGPSLHGVGALAADFYLQTGRMPLPSPRAQPLRTSPAFPPGKIKALVAYVASFGGPGIPTVQPRRGSLADGQRLFGLDCAGCHSIQGQGGIVTGAIVPSLNEVTPTQVGEAVRIGPYVMPRFGEGQLSDAQVSSLARYIQSIQHPDNLGGWGIGRIGPIPEGMVAWLLAAAALLLIARLLGERTGGDPEPARHARDGV
jgi:ubiquinol-cytochrome c reductase cytochrome c subunit